MKPFILICLLFFSTNFVCAQSLKDEYMECVFKSVEAQNFDQAIAYLSDIIALSPQDSTAYNDRGLLKELLFDYQGAILDFGNQIKIVPTLADSYFFRALAKDKINDKKGAFLDYQKTVRYEPTNSDAHYYIGLFFAENKQFQKAILSFDTAIKSRFDNAKAYASRGWVKAKLNHFKTAFVDFEQAKKIDATSIMTYYYSGFLNLRLKNFQAAQADFKKAISLDYSFENNDLTALFLENKNKNWVSFLKKQNQNPKLKPSDHSELAILNLDFKQFQNAIFGLDKAIEANPKMAVLYYKRSLAFAGLKNFAAAKTAIADAMMLENSNPVFELQNQKVNQFFESQMPIKIEGNAQGTTYHISYFDKNNRNLKPEIEKILRDFDLSVSTYVPNSIISKINSNQPNVVLDRYFISCFEQAKAVWKNTNGAFDPTVFPIVNAWGFGPTKKQTIEKIKIDSMLQFVGFEKIWIKNKKIVKKEARVALDFNAFAQGYSVDVVSDFLKTKKITNFIVEIGGEVFASGSKPNGDKWTVGIEQPIDNKVALNPLKAVAKLSNMALATSGNYRRFVLENGIKYAHHIDPKTGFPTKNNLLSASVFSKKGIISDANATGILVMGLEKAKIFLNNNPELQAYLIYSDIDGTYKTYETAGLKDIISEIEE